MTEQVSQPHDLRGLNHFFCQMRWNEDHPAITPQHYIAGHCGSLANARWLVDTNERGVQLSLWIIKMMRRMIAAKKRREGTYLFQSFNVANGAIVYNAVSGFGINGIAEVIADGGTIF